MYRVEIMEKGMLTGVEFFEKLENAIYEGTHFGNGLLEKVNEKYHDKIKSTRPVAVILNDEFLFRWKCGVETRIKKTVARDCAEYFSHFLYEGDKI